MTNPTPQPPAPTPNVSETPRTDEVILSNVDMLTRGYKMRLLAESLERELAEVTKERDAFKAINDRKWYDSETYRAQLAAVTKERDILHDWKESALSILNEINFQEIGKALGLGLGLSVPKNILPGIRALRKQITAMTQARDALWIERCMVKGVVNAAGASENTLFGGVDKLGEQLTAALARAEKAEGTPALTSEEYFADRDAFVAYVLDEVNPARKAEGLDTCSAGLAGHLFQVISEHHHRP